MNCPKCNSPLNEGDKFCQVCGSVINNEPQQPTTENQVAPEATTEAAPAVAEVAPVPAEAPAQPAVAPVENQSVVTPEVPAAPVQPVVQPQPMNYNQPNTIPTQQPMNPLQEPKKNNTLVIVLIAIVVVLLIAVVFLFASGNKDDNKETPTNTPTTEEPGDTPTDKPADEPVAKYSTVTINGYKFKLPDGYYVEEYEGEIVLYDENMQVEAYPTSLDGVFENIDKEGYKAYLTSNGMTNVSYSTKTVNNKNMLIFVADYQGYKVEYIYVKYSANKITGATVVYGTQYNDYKETIYDIITNMEISDTSFSSNSGSKIPKLDVTAVIPKN